MKRTLKFLCLCMAMIFVWGVFPAFAAEQPAYVYWNFSRGSYSGLNIKANGGNVKTGEGLLIFDKTGTGNLEAGVNVRTATGGNLTGRVVVELDVFTTADKFLIYCQNSPLAGSVIRLQRYSNETLRIHYGNNGSNATKDIDFPDGVWNTLKVVLDFSSQTADIYMNGEPCMDAPVSFMTSGVGYTETLNQMILQHTGAAGTDLKIKDFAIYNNDDASAAQVSYEAINIDTEVTEDGMTLPVDVRGGSRVVWSSSAEELINSQTGQVRFPSMAEGSQTVVLTAEITHGAVTLNKSFNIAMEAKMSDEECVQADLAEIAVAETVYDTFQLPAVGSNGSAIHWTASPAAAFQISPEAVSGKFEVTTKRSEQDIYAVLTAEVSRGSVRVTKEFPVCLRRIITDAVSVQEDLENIQLPAVMTEGFELPSSGGNGTVITWQSDTESRLLIQEGKVHLLTSWPEDTQVTLTATAVKNGVTQTKAFTVLLEKDIEASAALLQNAVDKLQISPTSGVTADLTLPAVGENGTAITWFSADSSIISAEGKVIRSSSDKTVTLTAELERGGQKAQKAFRVTVKGTSGGSGFSGGGGSGRKPSKGTTVEIPRAPEQETKVPSAVPEVQNRFSDVSREHWAWQYIEALAQQKIVQGAQGRFEPERAVTREEFVKMVVSAARTEQSGEMTVLPFKDVEQGAWYVPYLDTALSNAWIAGISPDRFGVGDLIAREQAAVILWRILEPSESVTPDFRDNEEISDYAVQAVACLTGAGIMRGDENNAFRPADSLTRAEAAKLVCELAEMTGRAEDEK